MTATTTAPPEAAALTDVPHPEEVAAFTPPDKDPRWAELAAPFDAGDIEWKPQPLLSRAQREDGKDHRGQCDERHKDRGGVWCGGFHDLPAIHLAYVGHAGITARLNQVVTPHGWSWEPRYRQIDPGLFKAAIESSDPAIVRMLLDNAPPLYTDGGLWINLTILGVTFPGFGDAGKNTGPNGVKEIIGDAIRNAGLRFGLGTYLWSKSANARDLQAASGVTDSPGPVRAAPQDEDPPPPPRPRDRAPVEPAATSTAAELAIAQRRQMDRERYGNTPPADPQDAPPAAPRPATARDDGDVAALLDEIMSCTRKERLGELWTMAEGLAPGRAGRAIDVRRLLDPAPAAILDAHLPPPNRPAALLGAVIAAAGFHLEAESMSVRDHVAADTADIDPATGQSTTPPADAVPARS